MINPFTERLNTLRGLVDMGVLTQSEALEMLYLSLEEFENYLKVKDTKLYKVLK